MRIFLHQKRATIITNKQQKTSSINTVSSHVCVFLLKKTTFVNLNFQTVNNSLNKCILHQHFSISWCILAVEDKEKLSCTGKLNVQLNTNKHFFLFHFKVLL